MKLPYRAELDGLRAVAVCGVILYHANFSLGAWSLFSGGFLGVDVFFVISGYLITAILLRDLQAGSFSFLNFYERRARRILPALCLMMAVSAPFALLLMDAKALQEYAGSTLSSLGFVSNLWFWLEDSYTAEPSALKPLLHTWSLSVEEQFYLLYPVALLLLWRLRRHLLALFASAALLSLLLAQYGSEHFASANFFALPTRAWELLAGALMAVLEWRYGRQNMPNSSSRPRWMAVTGLGAILASFLLFDDGMPHPSLLTLVPVVGTLLLIRHGQAAEGTGRLLARRPLVLTGLLSYSLYLWHWPVLAFGRLAGIEMNALNTALLLLLSLPLALLSYHCVEQPVRQRRRLAGKSFALGLGSASVSLAALFVGFYLHGQAQLRDFRFEETPFDVIAESGKRYERYFAYCGANQEFCNEPVAGKVNLLVVGDSMAVDVINMLAPQLPDHHFVVSAVGGCPPFPRFRELADPLFPDLEKCLDLNRQRFAEGGLVGIDGVIIDVYLDWYKAEHPRAYLEHLTEEGMGQVLFVGNYLHLNRDLPEIFREHGGELGYADLRALGYVLHDRDHDRAVRELVRSYGFEYFDLWQASCPGNDCRLSIGQYPFSWDRFHLSTEFAEYLGTLLRERQPASWLFRAGGAGEKDPAS